MEDFDIANSSSAIGNFNFRQVDGRLFNSESKDDSSQHNDKHEIFIPVHGNVVDATFNTEFRSSSTVVSVFDVACYVMSKVKQCTTMKLQKLLYYCQAWHLVWNERPLFKENIEAWANGPVIRELYNFYKGLFNITENMMTIGNPYKLTTEQKNDIDSVLAAYGGKNSQWLIDQTHFETPWRDARKGLSPQERGHVIITHAAMAEYYSSLYEQEE